MNRNNGCFKRPSQHLKTPIDFVSASELLKALHTLENIHSMQQQIEQIDEQDLNISFCQKEGFNPDERCDNKSINKVQKQNEKNLVNKSSNKIREGVNSTSSKIQNQNSKMNFQFYMTKKESNLKDKNKPTTQNKSRLQLQNNNQSKSTRLISQNTCQPRKSIDNLQRKSSIFTTKKKDITPLTERSMNIPLNQRQLLQQVKPSDKGMRIKTQVSWKENINFQKTFTRQLPRSSLKQKRQLSTFQSKKPSQKQLNKIQPQRIQSQLHSKQTTIIKSHLYTNQSSIHQRTLEFIRHKNEKIAQLSQQIQLKRKQQQKECTFKPKILSNNSNVKSKYNDYSNFRQVNAKYQKKCQNDVILREVQHVNKDIRSKKVSLQMIKNDQSGYNGQSPVNIQKSQQNTSQTQASKRSKYKNSKFNILLDMIN